MDRQSTSTLNVQVSEQACKWFVEFRTGQPDEAARKSFHAWLNEAPSHMGAYLQVAAIWNEGPSLGRRENWTVENLIAQARGDVENVVAMPASAEARRTEAAVPRNATASVVTPSARRRLVSHSPYYWLAASVLLAVIAGLFWTYRTPVYATETGEQRVIALADHSTVYLNSRSRIAVRLTDKERFIDLQEGQALFQVAKDPSRPFVVATAGTRIRAVGTQFDVYKKSAGVTVTVVEGRVAVTRPESSENEAFAAAAKPTLLAAGDQLTITPQRNSKIERPNIAAATAWTLRQLVFESAPLAEVAQEFNRYNGRKLVISDPLLETFKIDGVFSSTDPTSLIRFLQSRRDMRVIESDSKILIAPE